MHKKLGDSQETLKPFAHSDVSIRNKQLLKQA